MYAGHTEGVEARPVCGHLDRDEPLVEPRTVAHRLMGEASRAPLKAFSDGMKNWPRYSWGPPGAPGRTYWSSFRTFTLPRETHRLLQEHGHEDAAGDGQILYSRLLRDFPS